MKTCNDCIHKSICYWAKSTLSSCADKCEDFKAEKTGYWIDCKKHEGTGFFIKENAELVAKILDADVAGRGYQLEGGEWIPVSERLPENSGDYLVCGHGKIWICEMLNLYGVRGWCSDVKNPIVEAWMPLPQPYRKEQE